MIKVIIKSALLFSCLCAFCFSAFSQFSLSAQLRARTELRDGQGTPLPIGSKAAAFISQRTRLIASFNMPRIKTGISLQDVRVWGQDVSTINRTTMQELNGLLLHEAWAEVLLSDTAERRRSLSLKIGRQELIYDDQRLIGNLDWLQQGRRHDALVLKFEQPSWKLHMGAAFNQNKENQAGTVYNNSSPGNYPASTNGGQMYKSMEYLYVGRKLKKGNASFLFFSDQFNKYKMEMADNALVKVFEPGAWTRFTTGVYFTNDFNRLNITGSAYYQFGKNSAGVNTKAHMLTIGSGYQFGKFNAGAGIDYTSGDTAASVNKSFDPLYGTPHKFWGTMDYFYAASPFGKGGLVDYYLRLKYRQSTKLIFSADLHHFKSASRLAVTSKQNNRNFGEELDLLGAYTLTKDITVEAGYSHFFTTSLLSSPSVKNVANARPGSDWAYIMINIKPEFIFK